MVLAVNAESVVPVASKNTMSGEIPLERVTWAFSNRDPLVAEHVGPGDPPPPLPTAMLKAGNGIVVRPSLTLMMMFPNVPAAFGVPVSAPVVVLNDAQLGICWMLKVSIAPRPPVTLGVNE